ncbi:MAG: hypothetical protein QM809_00125 [Gordonia sp. (in: high G+C Gram-positive bacteria)]|uniref:hypothetical protein n=1 Tax=Gordonia sp. (in: high G+C Gram-positive bacteria) TaxID=84139 RepID=UPI0039E45D09
MQPFDANDYRKRVLAAVLRRGGAQTSNVFELYDLPIDEAATLPDAAVLARIDEVWAFWQKHRDHPKYRSLVAELVATHEVRSAPLRRAVDRAAAATAARGRDAEREAERFELVDAAAERLVARYGGIPSSKRAGLDDLGAVTGLSPAEVAERVRRHPMFDDAVTVPAAPRPAAAVSSERMEQIRRLLAEFDRLQADVTAPTLTALLQLTLDDVADRDEIALRVEGLGRRARELPAGRLRAVVDELLVHAREVLLGDRATAEYYRRAVTDEVADHLRPRLRAAVLVEDELLDADRLYLVDEAQERGMGPTGARELLRVLAAEIGVTAEAPHAPATAAVPASVTSGIPAAAPATRSTATVPETVPTGGGDWESALRAARTALRDGRLDAARAHCIDALTAADGDAQAIRRIRAVSDEVEDALAQRDRPQDPPSRGLPAQNPPMPNTPVPSSPVSSSPEPSPQDLPRPTAQAASAADSGAVDAPGEVTVSPAGSGTVRVRWRASSTPGVIYRVVRLLPDGRTQVVGRTEATGIDDGGVPPGASPEYGVVAILDGRKSVMVRSGGATSSNAADPGRPVFSRPTPTPVSPRLQAASASELTDDLPGVAVRGFTDGLLGFDWPEGITEVMVYLREDAPPAHPTDPAARAFKVTNTKYSLDGGFRVPGDAGASCYAAVVSCRRDPKGGLQVARVFGPRSVMLLRR